MTKSRRVLKKIACDCGFQVTSHVQKELVGMAKIHMLKNHRQRFGESEIRSWIESAR